MSDRLVKAGLVLVAVAAVGLGVGLLLNRSGERPKPGKEWPPLPKTFPWVLPDDPNGGERRPPTAQEVREATASATAYLARMCDENGRFVYLVNMNPKVKVKPSYSVLRHEGALYAMATYAQRAPSDELLDAIGRAVRFLRDETIAPVPGHDDMLAVWSDPRVTLRDKASEATLGGAGLALMSLVCAEKVRPGTTSLDELRKLARFVLFMQDEDGAFATAYIPSEGGKSFEAKVLYYPGEAALGLLTLYELDPSPEWLEAAAKAIASLARQRQNRRLVELDHWALLATARLLPLYDRLEDPPIPREAVVAHAVQICESMLSLRPPHEPVSMGHGCFTVDGCTCPTATRLEGLQAALTFLPDEQAALRERIAEAVHAGVAFLIRAQVKSGEYAGGIPQAICRLPKTHASSRGSFNDTVTEIRIDYNQHAVSAMMSYEELFLDEQPQ